MTLGSVARRDCVSTPNVRGLGQVLRVVFSAAVVELGWLRRSGPYSGRHKAPQECATDKKFFASVSIDGLVLDPNHNYMYQVMGQLALYEMKWADFVIGTKKGLSVQRIRFYPEFWNKILGNLRNFYLTGMVAELFSDRVSAT